MTYFGFLLQFVGIPIIILTLLHWLDARQGKRVHETLTSWPASVVIMAHIIVALVYTTPWDNYLVATRVWWYDPELVTGFVIGWVPIEEYTFFIVQTLMTGMWTVWLMRRMPVSTLPSKQQGLRIRQSAAVIVGVIWLASCVALAMSFINPNWRPFTYLGLELAWALPPIMLQLVVGADILWRHRYTVMIGILSTWLYLSAMDAVAIQSGTWTINPEQSLPILIGGVLPIEEAIFFLVTNVLVVFGLTLVMEHESESRVPKAFKMWLQKRKSMRLQVNNTL